MLKNKDRQKINPKQIQKDYLSRIEDELKDEENIELYDEDNVLNINNKYVFIPKDLSNISSNSLAEHLNAFTQKKIYMRTVLCRVLLELEQRKRTYLEKSHKQYETYSTRKLTETAKERMINNDKNVKPYYEDYINYKNKKYLIESTIESTEDIIFLLSRELTRRNKDFEDEIRNSKFR